MDGCCRFGSSFLGNPLRLGEALGGVYVFLSFSPPSPVLSYMARVRLIMRREKKSKNDESQPPLDETWLH